MTNDPNDRAPVGRLIVTHPDGAFLFQLARHYFDDDPAGPVWRPDFSRTTEIRGVDAGWLAGWSPAPVTTISNEHIAFALALQDYAAGIPPQVAAVSTKVVAMAARICADWWCRAAADVRPSPDSPSEPWTVLLEQRVHGDLRGTRTVNVVAPTRLDAHCKAMDVVDPGRGNGWRVLEAHPFIARAAAASDADQFDAGEE